MRAANPCCIETCIYANPLFGLVGILEEIRHYSADIVNLQEVEKVQYNDFFLPELQKDGYEGIFEAKGRIKNMYDDLKHHVDGCAILWKKSKWVLAGL